MNLVTLGLLVLSFLIARIPMGNAWYDQRSIDHHERGPLPPWPAEPPESDSEGDS